MQRGVGGIREDRTEPDLFQAEGQGSTVGRLWVTQVRLHPCFGFHMAFDVLVDGTFVSTCLQLRVLQHEFDALHCVFLDISSRDLSDFGPPTMSCM
jgi:hypothetical protein